MHRTCTHSHKYCVYAVLYTCILKNYRFMVNRGPIEVQWLRSCWVSVPRRRKTSPGRVRIGEKKKKYYNNIYYIRQNPKR